MGIALAVLVIILENVTEGAMLRPLNVSNLIHQNMYVFILGMGMLLCVHTGGNIDLSVGSIVVFAGAVCGVLMVDLRMSAFPAILLVLLTGLLVGAWNGFWISVVKVHPWITTLAGELLFRGLAQVILNGRSIGPYPDAFQFLATGFFPDIVEGAERHMLTLLFGVVISVVFIVVTLWGTARDRRRGLPTASAASLAVKIIFFTVCINALCYVLSGSRAFPSRWFFCWC